MKRSREIELMREALQGRGISADKSLLDSAIKQGLKTIRVEKHREKIKKGA